MNEPKKTRTEGDTVPVQGEQQQPAPRMPHERDESADSQAASEPSMERMGAEAHDSLEKGQVDTDKGPVLDATYDRVREGTPRPDKQFRR